ncbi:MAG: ABC transporter permease [Caldilineae bacterium]|nr:ABC transporter permease [Chloroflexota bacterium]MCB9176308.1 ABC transporter permease [Caldilineae bacterium]
MSARRIARNWPLVSGLCLIGVMLSLALGAPWMDIPDPMAQTRFVRDETGYHWKPFEPGEVRGFPLGTDFDGRDVRSRLIWGLRPTLLLALSVALIRIALAASVGILAGWDSGSKGRLAGGLIHLSNMVPLLVVAIVLLYLVGGGMRAGDMILALSVTGWSGAARLVAARVRGLRHVGYIEAARALGAGPGFILRKHVIPALTGLLPVLAAFEMAAALLLLGELGFLGFYLGGGTIRGVARTDTAGSWLVRIPGQPELGQMLSVGWENFFQSKWLSLWAGLAFGVSVAAFLLLGEGLRRAWEARARRRVGARAHR